MKAVILAAGKSTRTFPLTMTKPKPLLKIANKTLLEHNLEQLEGLVDEVIIIVGYKKDMIIEKFGKRFNKLKLTYVEQKEQLGTAHALMQAKKHIKDRFVVFNGDDFYSKEDIKRCAKHKYSILTKKVEDTHNWGIVEKKGDYLKSIVEKPKNPKSDLANIGLYVFDKDVFDIKVDKSERGEYEIPSLIMKIKEKVRVEVCKGCLVALVYPWSMLTANEILLKKIKKNKIKGKVEKGVTIKGVLVLGKNSVVKSGAYIEGTVVVGENGIIGPRAFLRGPTAIGDKCNINAEVKNSVVMDNTNIAHSSSYIGDSVLGENVNIGAGTNTANWRHDGKSIKCLVKGKLFDTGLNKLGVITGDNVHTGINTAIYPGRMIWPGKTTLPGEVVRKNIE